MKAALIAVNQESTVGPVTPLSNAARHAATQGAKQANGGDHPVFEALGQGAFEQLMTFLRYPDSKAWQSLATTTALAPAQSGTKVNVEDGSAAVDQAAAGDEVTLAEAPTDIAAVTWVSQNDLRCVVVLKQNGDPVPSAVVSLDTSEESDKNRWADWLHLGNILQHLGEPAVITTTRTYAPGILGAVPTASAEVEQGVEWEELLTDVFDPAAVPLARAAIAAGWTELVVGYESGDADDTPIEVAWLAAKVGILPSGGNRPGTLEDWDLRFADGWTEDLLVAALEGDD